MTCVRTLKGRHKPYLQTKVEVFLEGFGKRDQVDVSVTISIQGKAHVELTVEFVHDHRSHSRIHSELA